MKCLSSFQLDKELWMLLCTLYTEKFSVPSVSLRLGRRVCHQVTFFLFVLFFFSLCFRNHVILGSYSIVERIIFLFANDTGFLCGFKSGTTDIFFSFSAAY